MIETLKNAFRNKDIRKKIIMTLLLLLLFRIGCYIPIPGLERATFETAITGNDFLALMSGITGNALANGTLFALGIGPYINASIIMQLLTVGIPALERLSKQGEEGRKKISNITRIVTIVLAVIQSVGIIVLFGQTAGQDGESAIQTVYFGNQMWATGIFMAVVYTAGACIVMWIGERITEYGVGNGISMIIFVGILSTAGTTLVGKFGEAFSGDVGAIWSIVVFVVIAVVIFFAIVYVDLAERRIPVQYAKQVRGTKMYGGQSSVIPMKITGSGVMPLIFAYAIISLPSMIMSLIPSCARPVCAHLRVRILLCADPVQSRGRLAQYPAERRLHPGHPPRQAHGGISFAHQQAHHAVRRHLPDAGRVHSVHRVQLGGARSRERVLHHGYPHRRFGRPGVR